jgi:hypothetical protein
MHDDAKEKFAVFKKFEKKQQNKTLISSCFATFPC